MRRATYILVASILVVVAISTIAMFAMPTMNEQKHSGVRVILEIEQYRNNKLVKKIVKEGDLIVENFAKLLVKIFAGENDPDGDDDIIRMDGVTHSTYIANVGGTPGQIHLGTGTNSPTLSDTVMQNEIVAFNVQDCDISYSGDDMIVDCFGSYTFDTSASITEVGLSFYCGVAQALVAHDVLSTALSINAGDAIVVHYKFVIDNP